MERTYGGNLPLSAVRVYKKVPTFEGQGHLVAVQPGQLWGKVVECAGYYVCVPVDVLVDA